jgi:hypothetical protein
MKTYVKPSIARHGALGPLVAIGTVIIVPPPPN